MSGFDLSNFLAAFFDEARDRLVSINRGLVEFESETIDEEGLISLRRDAHTIKGSALMLGVVDLGAVAHLFEDAMELLIQSPELRVPKMTQFLYDLHDELDERLEYVDTEVRLDDKKLKVRYDELLKQVRSEGDGEEVADTAPVEEYSMIGAEEAADWKKQQDGSENAAPPPPLSDASLDYVEPANANDFQPDIDAMMPEGMFVEDAIDELLSPTPDVEIQAVEDTPDQEDFNLIIEDDTPTFALDDQESLEDNIVEIDIEELDDVFTLEGLDNDLGNEGLDALLGDIGSPSDVFVYGENEEALLKAEEAAEKALLAAQEKTRLEAQKKAEQARLQAQEKAAEQARLQAQEKAAEQARLQAQEKAAEQARLQAQEKAAEQARLQAQEKAAEQARLQAQEKVAELARLQAQEKAAEQTRLQAQEKAAEQTRLQAQEKAAELARLQAQEKAAEQTRLQAQEKPKALTKPSTQAQEKAAELARLQAQEKAAEQTRLQAQEKPKALTKPSTQAKPVEQKNLDEDERVRQKIQEKAARQARFKAREKAIEKARIQALKIQKDTSEKKKVPTGSRSSARPHTTPVGSQGQAKGEKTNRFRPEIVSNSASSGRSTGQRKASGRFLRVDAARLEELSSFVVELSTERSRNEEVEVEFRGLLHEFRDLRVQWRGVQRGIADMDAEKQTDLMETMDRSFDRGMRKMSRFMENQRFSQLRGEMMLKELRDQVLSLMLRPLDNVFSTFPRAVRDVAVKLEKRVKLVVDGSAVEIDQGISEMLVEPLVHLLNNSVSHGVEMPDERKRLGKPPIAQVSIIARQSGSEIHIEVIDDGRGLDEELIKSTAVERGVTTQLEADQMASAEILEMIFRPGFSTKKNVSDVSGRGIGMNVVQDAVRRLTGSIRIDSELGKGTRFLLSLPVSIAVQHALTFRMANANFGMLTHLVEQIVPLSAQTIEKGPGDKDYIRYGHSMVALVDMRTMLADGDESELASEPYVIIAEHIEGFVGIVVDDVLDELEIVVRELDPYVKRYQPQGLMGTTIAADGSVLILLEPYGIKEMGRTAPDQAISIEISEEEKMAFSVLLVEDSLIARQIEKGIFESIGFTVETAIDGLDGLDKLKKGKFDLIVTDLEMPRLDGFGFVRRIRNQPEYEELPIMVISTRESAEDRMRALEAGADAYMIKQQLQGDKILETVQSLVGETESV